MTKYIILTFQDDCQGSANDPPSAARTNRLARILFDTLCEIFQLSTRIATPI